MYDKFNPVNFGRVGIDYAKLLKPALDDNRLDVFCSHCINLHITGMAYILADTLCEGDLLNNMEALKVLHNIQINTLPMQHCMQLINKDAVVGIVLESAYTNATVDNWIKSIVADLMLFAAWTIWEGGDGKTVRKYIASKTQKNIVQLKGKIGVNGILTRYERAIYAFNTLREKLFVPKYRELKEAMNRATYVEKTESFNTIQWKR